MWKLHIIVTFSLQLFETGGWFFNDLNLLFLLYGIYIDTSGEY